MKKLIMMAVAAATMTVTFAEENPTELQQTENQWNNWRLTAAGFGRGNMRARIPGMGSDRVTAYGVDLDLQYNVWQNSDFNLWAGIGGTFCPRQKASGSYGYSKSRSVHQVSDDTYTTYDFNYNEISRAEVELAYGECRLMAVPEWKITDSLALGARLGAAFDWINAKCSYRNDWAWNSKFDINIPGLPREIDTDGDQGGSSGSDAQTKFAAQAILGVQATYMFTDYVGIYGNFDWRLGGDTTFENGQGDKLTVDLSGWYWGAGVVVSF